MPSFGVFYLYAITKDGFYLCATKKFTCNYMVLAKLFLPSMTFRRPSIQFSPDMWARTVEMCKILPSLPVPVHYCAGARRAASPAAPPQTRCLPCHDVPPSASPCSAMPPPASPCSAAPPPARPAVCAAHLTLLPGASYTMLVDLLTTS